MKRFLLLIAILFCAILESNPPLKIAIVTETFPDVAPWDLDSIQNGIAGSEEAVIYLSQELTKLGYQVTVFGNPPLGSVHSLPEANPRFIQRKSLDEADQFDIAIAWRVAKLGKTLKRHAHKVYLWPHDEDGFQGLTKKQVNFFDNILWISQWQQKQWATGQPAFAEYKKIFGNGVNIDQFQPVKERSNPYSCIYGSNYARGLEILLDIWPAIKQRFPKATLDIYYGWKHWGNLPVEKEKKMREQIEHLKDLGVCDHGLVSHAELNGAYETAAFWTYPCIANETFCITALRAQLAGAVPVIIERSALTETVRHGFKCFKQEDYLALLLQAMEAAETITLEDRQRMGDFVRQEYTWNKIAEDWKALFEADLENERQRLLRAILYL